MHRFLVLQVVAKRKLVQLQRMAAAAIVEMAGGTPQQSSEAFAITLKNMLGLVCDPVAGLVEVPCVKRNAMGAANALVAADMALAGVYESYSCDEVIGAMYRNWSNNESKL